MILAPEVVVTFAAGQRADAKRVRARMHKLGYSQWTLCQSFYANMGGFTLRPRDSTPFPIHGRHLVYLVKKGYMTLPTITSTEVADKSKANFLTKALVCLQTGWFVLQCFGRFRQGLPLISLELVTISYVWCTWAIYAQWFSKPLDIAVPTVLDIEASTAEILLEGGPRAAQPYRSTPLDFVFEDTYSWTLAVQPVLHFHLGPRERPMPRLLNDSFPEYEGRSEVPIVSFIIIFYGVILMLGWNFVFPTSIERLLWRIATLLVTCIIAAVVAWELLWGLVLTVCDMHMNGQKITLRSIYYLYRGEYEKVDPVNKLPVSHPMFNTATIASAEEILIVPLMITYVIARLCITAEALASLRALPGGCFQNVDWAKFIPHF